MEPSIITIHSDPMGFGERLLTLKMASVRSTCRATRKFGERRGCCESREKASGTKVGPKNKSKSREFNRPDLRKS